MKPKTWAHPKFEMLQTTLGIPKVTAAGILEGLWYLAATFDDDVGRIGFSGSELVSWMGLKDLDGEKLVQALVKCRWLDKNSNDELIVHDWQDHKPNYLKNRIRQRKHRELSRDSHVTQHSCHVTVCDNNAPSASASVSASASERKRSTSASADVCAVPQGTSPTNSNSEYGFPIKGGRTWYLSARKLEEYRDSYPELDLDSEFRKARQWLRTNIPRRKTPQGMPNFLTSWLNRASDKNSTGQRTRQTLADIIGENYDEKS